MHATRRDDLQKNDGRRTALVDGIAAAESTLDAGLQAFDELRERVRDLKKDPRLEYVLIFKNHGAAAAFPPTLLSL